MYGSKTLLMERFLVITQILSRLIQIAFFVKDK